MNVPGSDGRHQARLAGQRDADRNDGRRERRLVRRADAEWYSAFVHIGDRGMIPYYINESMKKFEQTGFTGATTYKRDGVSPADDGWWECMPNMALPSGGSTRTGTDSSPPWKG